MVFFFYWHGLNAHHVSAKHVSLAYQSMTNTIRYRSICFPFILCYFLSISRGNIGLSEGNGKCVIHPSRNIEIATKSPPHGENLRNFSSIICLTYSPGDDDVLHNLLAAPILVSISSPPLNRPQNLATDLKFQSYPNQARKNCTKTAKLFINVPPTIIEMWQW